MRLWMVVVSLGTSLLLSLPVWAQGPVPSCEESIESQYRLLATENLVPESLGAPWLQHLTALAATIRQSKTLLDMEENQTKLGKKNIALLYDQIQQAQKQILTLQDQLQAAKGALEKLQHGSAPAAN